MLAIRVGQVFGGEQVLPDAGVVLVEGGRILSVQPHGMALPGVYAVADHPDATLLPGLIDTHVHLCGDSGPGALDRLPTFSDEELTTVIEDALLVHLAVGVTTVRDLGDRLWAVLNWRDRHQETIGAPTVLASGLTDQARAQTVGRLHRAGVHLVSGSDGGITPGKRHGVLPEAVSALVDGDVSPTDALASATARAAVACGVGDRKGRVAAGFDADLLIVDGDPSPISAPTKGRGCLRGWTAALCLTPADRCAALPTTGRPKKRLSPRRQPRRRSVASRRDRGMPDRGGLPGGSASGWTYAGGTFRR